MSSPVWMIDFVAGQTWRFASRTVVYDGHQYTDGLETPGGFSNELSFSEPSESSMAITLFPQAVKRLDTEDVALGATATVYYWHDPSGPESPRIIVSGVVSEPEYGGPDEPLSCTVREVPWEDRGLIPNFEASINDDTWLNRDKGIDDEFYPTVIGEPGIESAEAVGSPAYYVQRAAKDLILIADHPVNASNVLIYDVTGPSTANLAVEVVEDGLGRNVSVVDATGYAALDSGDELWAIWNDGGGLPHPEDPSKLLTGAGDLIEYLLHFSTVRVDWGRVRAARVRLNSYRIDTYIQADPGQRISPWSWITDHLLPILPISVRVGPQGLYLAVFDPATPVGKVRGKLIEGINCDRVSAVTVLGTSDVANDYSLTYAPRADTDKGSKTVRVTGSAEVLNRNENAYRSGICERSVQRYGTISRELNTVAVYDDATAVRILTAIAAKDSLPARQVVYVMSPEEDITKLEPGEPVTITDSILGWHEKLAYVWSVTTTNQDIELTLMIYSQAGRDYALMS